MSQVTQRVLFSRGVVDCPACCDRLVTREREPWLLSVAKEGRERTRFKWSVVWCLWYRTKRTRGARAMRMCKFFPNQSARFLGFRRTLFFFQSQIYKKRMTRPPRVTKRYLSRTHKEERNTHTHREREREIDAPLGHDARRRRLQLSFVHQSVAVSVLMGKSSVSNLFQRHTTSRGKIRLQFFSFFFEKLCVRLAAFVVFALSVELDERRDVQRTTAPGGGFLLCEHQKRHRERERVLLPMVEMRDKKSGGSLRRESSPFLPPFSPDHLFRSIDKTFFWAAQNVPLNPLMRKSKKREREGHCSR